MANPTASDDGRRRRRARRRARSGHAEAFDKLRDDIEPVQQPTVDDLPGIRTDLYTSGSVPQRRVAHSTTMQTASVSRSASSTSASKHRNRRPLGHRSDLEERHHRRRKPSRNDGYEAPVCAPRNEKRPRTRISKARVLGNGDGSHTSSEKEGSMPAISEEKDARREIANQREAKAEKPGSASPRRRRRRTEEERVARRQAREVKESAASVSRNKTSSPRKESLQPLDFIRRTLSTSNVNADPRPVPKRSQSTSGSHLLRKSPAYESVTALNSGRRSSFMGMFTPAIKEEVPVKLVECLTCLSDDIPRSKSAKLKCGHRMCHSCLKRIFKLSVTDPQHMPPKCCTTDCIPLKHVDKLFEIAFKKNWNRKFQEYTTKNRIYCPSRRCGEWIKPGNIHTEKNGKKHGKCGRCKTKVCTLCNGKWHGKKDCPKDEETNRLLATAKEAGWQRCYSCRTMVELKEGCNHMTCRCKAEFCMICGLKWKTCSCSWFTYEPVAADDRLNHMRVPGAPDAADAPAADPLTRPLRPRDFAPGMDGHRRVEELIRRMHDVDLDRARARAPGPAAPVADDADDDGYNGGIGAIHGIGNAAGHFMNETYRRPIPQALIAPHTLRHLARASHGQYYGPVPVPVRDLAAEAYKAAPTTRPEERVVPRRRRVDYAGHAPAAVAVVAARDRRARVEAQEGPRPSVLAGLGGSRKGSGRVGEWRTHVELGVTPDEGVISYVS